MRNKVQYHPPEFVRENFRIDYGFHASPFGRCLVMVASGAVIGLAFVDKNQNAALRDMKARWPQAAYIAAPRTTSAFVKRIFSNQKLPLLLIGTDFQTQVWKKLLLIPKGETTHYGDLAIALGRPKAARAVGTAVGQNPISWIVPCHRVVRRDGGLGGYHWGLELKKKMLAAEKNNYKAAA